MLVIQPPDWNIPDKQFELGCSGLHKLFIFVHYFVRIGYGPVRVGTFVKIYEKCSRWDSKNTKLFIFGSNTTKISPEVALKKNIPFSLIVELNSVKVSNKKCCR